MDIFLMNRVKKIVAYTQEQDASPLHNAQRAAAALPKSFILSILLQLTQGCQIEEIRTLLALYKGGNL